MQCPSDTFGDVKECHCDTHKVSYSVLVTLLGMLKSVIVTLLRCHGVSLWHFWGAIECPCDTFSGAF